MASALARFAFATARSSKSSSNLAKSLNNALLRVQPSILSRLQTNPSSYAHFVRSLATAATTKTPKTRKTTTTKKKVTRKPATRIKKATAKPKKKPKKVAKKKPAPKKKVLTEKQKEAAVKRKENALKKKEATHVKDLRTLALTAPKQKATNTYAIFLGLNYKDGSGSTLGEKAKDIAAKYKALSPAEIEHLNEIAVENKAANEQAYNAWLKSHTPEEIRQANNARGQLRRRAKKSTEISGKGKPKVAKFRKIADDRLVKAPSQPFILYYTERNAAGVFRHIKAVDAMKLARDEYKELNASEKKKYTDLAEADKMRYSREYQATYGHAPPSSGKKVKAAATTTA